MGNALSYRRRRAAADANNAATYPSTSSYSTSASSHPTNPQQQQHHLPPQKKQSGFARAMQQAHVAASQSVAVHSAIPSNISSMHAETGYRAGGVRREGR